MCCEHFSCTRKQNRMEDYIEDEKTVAIVMNPKDSSIVLNCKLTISMFSSE